MFVCHEKKVNWYLNRGLAVQVQADPLTVRLTFEPNGPGHAGDPLYLQEWQNRCVRCGSDQELMRHHVVPICYRRYFPVKQKSHSAMDVVLLCRDCHEEYEVQADLLKKEVAAEFGLPAHPNAPSGDVQLCRVIKFARTLTGRHRENIPSTRREEMLNVIRDYYGTGSEEELLARALKERVSELFDGTDSVGKIVVERTADLCAFAIRWRRHFLATLQPRHMPLYWDPARPLERSERVV